MPLPGGTGSKIARPARRFMPLRVLKNRLKGPATDATDAGARHLRHPRLIPATGGTRGVVHAEAKRRCARISTHTLRSYLSVENLLKLHIMSRSQPSASRSSMPCSSRSKICPASQRSASTAKIAASKVYRTQLWSRCYRCCRSRFSCCP